MARRVLQVTATVLVTLCILSSVKAATIYMAPPGFPPAGGVNGNGCGSISQPCGSFAYAFNAANFGDTILLAPGTYNGQVVGCNLNGNPCNAGFVTSGNGNNLPGNPQNGILNISASTPGTVTVDLASSTRQFMNVADVSNVIFNSITFSGQTSYFGDGAVFSLTRCEFTFNNCIFQNNRAVRPAGSGSTTGRGGVMRLQDSAVTFNKCQFLNNKAPLGGGALYLLGTSNGDNSIFNQCTFTGNQITAASNTGAIVYDGGAIFIDGSPRTVFTQCTFTSNSARRGGAIGMAATVSFGSDILIDNCTFANNLGDESGGACDFYSINSLLINNSTFSGNSANAGGALYNRLFNFALNPIFIKTSVFKNNIANGPTDADVGGAIASTQPIDIRESSFTGNQAAHDGGAIHSLADVTIVDTTFSGNSAAGYYSGGAIYAGYSANPTYIYNSIFNNNIAGDGGAIGTTATEVTIGNCLFLGNTGRDQGGAVKTFSGQNVITGCEFNSNGAVYGGGVFTGSDATVTGCSFINNTATQYAGGLACVTPAAAGAFLKTLIVKENSFVDNTAATDGGGAWATCTVISELNDFDSNTASNGQGGAFYCSSGAKFTDISSTFEDNHANLLGGGVVGNCTFKLTGASFDGNMGYSGGALHSPNPITIITATFSNNVASAGNGGAILALNGITVTGSNFHSNSADGYRGGAIWATSNTTVTITTSTFDGNKAAIGGGIEINAPVVIVTDSHFLNNSALGGNGGGAYLATPSSTITTVEFANNNAVLVGAGLYTQGATTVKTSTFTANAAGSDGGGLMCDSAANTLSVTLSTFDSNSAGENGGGINTKCVPTLSRNTYNLNMATGGAANGGAVYSSSTSATTETLSTYSRNSATLNGGGIITSGPLTISQANFDSNSAGQQGGGIFGTQTLSISSVAFSNNVASASHGGGVSSSGTFTISDSNFTNNRAGGNGGGLKAESSSTIPVQECRFNGNIAALSGGGASLKASTVTLNITSWISNRATGNNGGGAFVDGNVNVQQNVFSGNTAGAAGGGLYATGNVVIDSTPFSSNTAGSDGGAVSCVNAGRQLDITGSSFTQNVAETNAGGIYSACVPTLTGNTYSSNSATNGDAGAFWCNTGAGSDTASTYSTNSAGTNGGAISASCTLDLLSIKFISNNAAPTAALFMRTIRSPSLRIISLGTMPLTAMVVRSTLRLQ